MLYTDRQNTPHPVMADMPRRELTPEEAEFVSNVAASLKEKRSDELPEGLSEGQMLVRQVFKDLQSPEVRAVLDDQTSKILLKIARGEPVVVEKPTIPPKKRGIVGRWFAAVLA
ncbi:MAG: hypothetical protein PHD48_11780 [Alphaproteobacteria bacterium]|nr:hypothetical protein [Alphaproteobacteria bacterium]